MSPFEYVEKKLGRAIEFDVFGDVDVEALASSLMSAMGMELELMLDINSNPYGFRTGRYKEYVIVDGSMWYGDYFRILAGVSHNLYDSYKVEYDEALGLIRGVLRS